MYNHSNVCVCVWNYQKKKQKKAGKWPVLVVPLFGFYPSQGEKKRDILSEAREKNINCMWFHPACVRVISLPLPPS